MTGTLTLIGGRWLTVVHWGRQPVGASSRIDLELLERVLAARLQSHDAENLPRRATPILPTLPKLKRGRTP